MSINLSFKNDIFALNKLLLPTRYYHFNDEQNYIKLLSIGEGIFPKDRIKSHIALQNSDVIFTTESATKVYPSKKEFGINQININLQNSNMEFLNDELILYKNSKLIQLLKINANDDSNFFYADILSHGRSYEEYEFTQLLVKNSFYIDGELEYLEKYNKKGDAIQNYLCNMNSKNNLFAKIYIKSSNNEILLNELTNYMGFEYTKSKKMMIGVISGDNMAKLKKQVLEIWDIYRKYLNKQKFNLGKQ
jgi:urease accessory protein